MTAELTEWEKINAEQNRLAAERRAAAEAKTAETAEQKTEKWFVLHGVPGHKSMQNLDAKLAEAKRAEKIERGERL